MKKPRDKDSLADKSLQEIEELKEANKHYLEVCIENQQLKAENEKLRNALERLSQWSKAYPLSVFPEPDFAKVRKALKEYNITLAAVSASNMRHVIKGIADIVEQALKEK